MDISRSGTGERYSSKHRECGHTPQNGQIRPLPGRVRFACWDSQTLMQNGSNTHRCIKDVAMYFYQATRKVCTKTPEQRDRKFMGQA